MSGTDLVILGGSITGLAVLRQAARSGYSAILVSEPNEIGSLSHFGRKLVCGPDDEVALRALNDICQAAPANLIATSDVWLRFIQRNDVALRETFAQVLHPDETVLGTCLDKSRFSAWCADHGIPSPRHFAASSVLHAGEEFYPLMLRPTTSSHDDDHIVEKAAEVSCADELARCLTRLRDAGIGAVITQSLLGRDLEQFSVGFVRRNESIASIVLLKRRPTAGACECGTFVERVIAPEVQALGEMVAIELDYFGIGEVEILRDSSTGECFVIEVNARPWLQFGLVTAAGYDWLTFLLNPDHYRPPALEKLSGAWLSFTDDLYVCFSRSVGDVRYGRIKLWTYLWSVSRVRAFSPGSFDDRRPFFCMLKRWLGLSPR